ncbi:MAG: hypothetical protein KDI30_12535, partial [Pseudomonadales bacterium]|nr:hypothetical protein [Pseudomonadales bacterium]
MSYQTKMVKIEKKPPEFLQNLWDIIKAPIYVPQTEGLSVPFSRHGEYLQSIPDTLRDGPPLIPNGKFRVIGYDRDVFDGGAFYKAADFDSYEQAKKQAAVLARGDNYSLDQGGYVVNDQGKLLYEAGCYVPPNHIDEMKLMRKKRNLIKIKDEEFFKKFVNFYEEYIPFQEILDSNTPNGRIPNFLWHLTHLAKYKESIRSESKQFSYISKNTQIKP